MDQTGRMDQTVHRLLMTLGGIGAGVGGLLAATDPSGLGVPENVWAWVAFVSAVCIVTANMIRTYWGTEPTSP